MTCGIYSITHKETGKTYIGQISLIIPCHRVVGSDGQLTGYAGGTEKKAKLLELEGLVLPGERVR